jgi:hypothetical protein
MFCAIERVDVVKTISTIRLIDMLCKVKIELTSLSQILIWLREVKGDLGAS